MEVNFGSVRKQHSTCFLPTLIRSLAKALGGSTTSLTSGIAGGGGGGSGGGGSRSSDEVARSRLTKGYFKELLSAHFRQPDLKVNRYRKSILLSSKVHFSFFGNCKRYGSISKEVETPAAAPALPTAVS